jgi:hypothetical protein
MEFKGTKGKWISKCLFNNWLIVHEESDNIIQISENKANAQLISCAPEMLEMLEKCENWIASCNENAGILNELEQLIKKATDI